MPLRIRVLLLLPCLALTAPLAAADVLVPKGGKAVRGALVSETGAEVVFNPYWSKNPEMTWEVVRLPKSRVKRVEVEPHPAVEVYRRIARAGDDADALVDIAAYAKEHKEKALVRLCLGLALATDPAHAGALKALGGRAKWEALRKGNPLLDPTLQDGIEAYVAEADGAERVRQARALKARGLGLKVEELERYRRAAAQPKGLQVDRPLTWLSDVFPGAVYTLFVPASYEPTRPWPLLIGLHGGGPDGKRGDELVGSGPSAMNFYRQQAAKHGFLVACPTALHAGWGSRDNEAFVRAVIAEMKHLYHVDIDRIYLTGHSMGGFGTWALGPRLASELAAISPMAGGGRGNISDLVKTRTPIFIYHSDNDYVSVSSDRQAAKRLRDTDLDFVYTELPGKGHDFPAVIQAELFDFLIPRRRFDPKHKDAWPRSSFAGKVTKEEKTYLGDPRAALKGEAESLDDWIDGLRLGGGRGAQAAASLAAARPPEAAAAVAKLVKDAKLSPDARAWAARALGGLGDVERAKPLRRAVGATAERTLSRLVIESARALGRLEDPEAGPALAKGIEAWTTYFEDKVVGGKVAFSDWQRALPVLTVLVEVWADLPCEGDVGDLASTVVKRVLALDPSVQTSERVPQDPARARAALAKAIARAYARWGADAGEVERLRDAVKAHPQALAATSGE